jgi:hypothetical protein
VKRLLVILALLTCLLVGCGAGQGVKLNDISYVSNECQEELVGHPMYWAIWTIKPSKAVTIDHVALSPTRHPKVQIVETVAETRNAGGIGGQPWPQVQAPSFGDIPKGHSFDGWLGIRPASHLAIAAHEQVTFGLVLRPQTVGITSWKGLSVYYNGTSTLIPTTLSLDVKTKIHGRCTVPNQP